MADVCAPPHGRIGPTRVFAEAHSRLVRANHELEMRTRPRGDHRAEIGYRQELKPAAWRHVEQPPPHPLEPALDARPGLDPGRVEAVGWRELDRETHSRGHADGLLVELARGGPRHVREASARTGV